MTTKKKIIIGICIAVAVCAAALLVYLLLGKNGKGEAVLGGILSNAQNKEITLDDLSFKMVKVEHGSFVTDGGNSASGIQKQITLSHDYYIGETEVTQALWMKVMGSNPSHIKGDNLPVERVSWNDCQEFLKRLNEKTGKQFRLPTEAEWEFAARGGNQSKKTVYAGSNILDSVGWYYNNSKDATHPVATRQPNELGIYDMSGNVYEWCNDTYGALPDAAQTDPKGAAEGPDKVVRGGAWSYDADYCSVSNRVVHAPADSRSRYGLRLCLSKDE